jgi:hypothetical protein
VVGMIKQIAAGKKKTSMDNLDAPVFRGIN